MPPATTSLRRTAGRSFAAPRRATARVRIEVSAARPLAEARRRQPRRRARARDGPRTPPRTPLAGRALRGRDRRRRRARATSTLPSVVPGRRYVVGKGEGCDIVVNGTYASRRHCEIWLDNGAWWVDRRRLDQRHPRRSRATACSAAAASTARRGRRQTAIELAPGARIVLSALARRRAGDYPRVLLRRRRSRRARDAARTGGQAPTTPVTPIARRAPCRSVLTLTVRMASGERTRRARAPSALPFRVGRSRNQDAGDRLGARGRVGPSRRHRRARRRRAPRSSCTATTACASTASSHRAGRAIPLAGRARRCSSGAHRRASRAMHADAVARRGMTSAGHAAMPTLASRRTVDAARAAARRERRRATAVAARRRA